MDGRDYASVTALVVFSITVLEMVTTVVVVVVPAVGTLVQGSHESAPIMLVAIVIDEP